jgi:hypothetical protein
VTVRVTINRGGIERMKSVDINQWLATDILPAAHREAVALVNYDFGHLRSSIGTAIEPGPVGFLFAGTNYAIWQEFEPGEAIPGVGTRRRRGGKPFLRPAVIRALKPYTKT